MPPRQSLNVPTAVIGNPLDDEEVEISPGLFIRGSRWSAEIRYREYVVSLIIKRTRRGHICEAVNVRQHTGGGVTGEILRSIPLATWVELVVGLPFAYRKDGEGIELPASAQESLVRTSRTPKEKLLPVVAEAYRRAIADPATSASPTQAVADELGYQRGHISRLLSEARKAGYLAPARRGRAGEFPDE